MDFFDVVAQRRSVRAIESRAIENEKIERILETISLAPTAGNLQSFRVYLVRSQEVRQLLLQASFGKQRFIVDAPIVLVFCALPERAAVRYRERGARLYALQDATIACAHVQLAAVALGLATTWVGAFSDEAVVEALGLSDDEVPVAMLPIGYPATIPSPTSRRPLSEIVREV